MSVASPVFALFGETRDSLFWTRHGLILTRHGLTDLSISLGWIGRRLQGRTQGRPFALGKVKDPAVRPPGIAKVWRGGFATPVERSSARRHNGWRTGTRKGPGNPSGGFCLGPSLAAGTPRVCPGGRRMNAGPAFCLLVP